MYLQKRLIIYINHKRNTSTEHIFVFCMKNCLSRTFNFKILDCSGSTFHILHFPVAASWSSKSVAFTFNEAYDYSAYDGLSNANKYFKLITFSAFLSHPFYSYLMNFSLISITISARMPILIYGWAF